MSTDQDIPESTFTNPEASTDQNLSGTPTDSPASGDQLMDGFADLAPQGEGDPLAPYGRKADGTPKAKPGRRSNADKGSAPMTATEVKIRAKKAEDTEKTKRIASDNLAANILNLAVGTMVQVVGPEWAPQNDDEKVALKSALSDYLYANGKADMSPGLVLAITVGGYSFARFHHENTRSKFGAIFGGLWRGVKTAYKRFFG